MALVASLRSRDVRATAPALFTRLVVSTLVAWMVSLPCAARSSGPRLEFDIAAGPLGSVLLEIAQAAGSVVSFSPSLVHGRQAPAVRGAYSLVEALMLATRPSGLTVETTPGGTLTISEASPDTPAALRPPGTAAPAQAAPAPSDDAAAVLPRVVVLGSAGPSEDGLKALRGTSATRTDTLLADIPQSVSVLTGDALDLQGGATSTEALRYVTGVSARIDGSGGQGIVPSLLVRGLPALYALSGMGYIRASLPMDKVFVDRIEVPKGPSGVISGVSTFAGHGGVVNLVRKEAGVDPRQSVSFSQTSQDGGTLRAETDLAGRATQELSWRLVTYGSATGRTDGGYEHSGGGGLLGSARYRNQDLTATLTLQSDRRRITPAATSRGGVLRPDGSISPVEDGQAAPPDAGDRLLSGSVDAELGLEWRFRPRWRMMLKTRIEAVDNDIRQHPPLLPQLERRVAWRNVALQWGLLGDVDTGPVRHKVLLGVDLADWRMRLLDVVGTPPNALTEVGDVKQEVLLQDQLRFGNLRVRLAAQAARVPEYDISTPGAVSAGKGRRAVNWDAGALYRLSSSASVYAGSQRSIETDIVRAVGTAVFDGATEPTRTQQVQAGLKLDLLDDTLALTLEAYRTEQTHVPGGVSFGSPEQAGRYFVTPRRVVEGLEIDLAGRPWPVLDIQLGMSFMRANDLLAMPPGSAGSDIHAPAGAIPARSMHLISRYRLPERWMPHTNLGLMFRARSSSFAIPPSPLQPGVLLVLPGGAQLDLSLERRFGPWAVSVFVHNVFDRQIYETQSTPGYIPLEPRRSFGLTATYKSQAIRP